MLLELDALKEPTLENFIPDGNAEMLDALRKIAAPGGAHMAVVIWGQTGSGKSHLLKATASLARRNGLAVAGARACTQGAGGDLAVADDADSLDETGQEGLFRALDLNKVRGRPAVLASCSAAPARLAMREDLRTRLGLCLVFGVRRLGDKAKEQALASYAQRLGRKGLPGEVVEYLVRREPRHLGGLLDAFASLDRYALLHRKTLNLRTTREWYEQRGEHKPGNPQA